MSLRSNGVCGVRWERMGQDCKPVRTAPQASVCVCNSSDFAGERFDAVSVLNWRKKVLGEMCSSRGDEARIF